MPVKKSRRSENMRFRQVHLDFHTSQLIPGIGEKFDKEHWQKTLKEAEVDSITCFSCCHHGYSYHPTKVGKMHPELKFNLLRAQIDACHEIGINVPIYLTAGVNQYACEMNPGWRAVDCTGRYTSWNDSPLKAGYFKICFNADGYMDYLCALLKISSVAFALASAASHPSRRITAEPVSEVLVPPLRLGTPQIVRILP